MFLFDIFKVLERVFPKSNALPDDRTGIQLNLGDVPVSRAYIAYELTEEVVLDAISKGAELIIAFHPLIYRQLSLLDNNERVGRILINLVKNNISLYVVHTIFDTHTDGTNKILADKLGLDNLEPIVNANKEENCSMGLIGSYEHGLRSVNFLEICREIFGSPIRYCYGKHDKIRRVAVIGGSGTSYLNNVTSRDVDAFVTADVSYHTFHAVNGKIWLVDPGHYEMEQFVAYGMYKLLKDINELKDIELIYSKINTNPINYLN